MFHSLKNTQKELISNFIYSLFHNIFTKIQIFDFSFKSAFVIHFSPQQLEMNLESQFKINFDPGNVMYVCPYKKSISKLRLHNEPNICTVGIGSK